MRVLVTRARADAERTAQRLAERGHHVTAAPVTELAPTGDSMPADPFDALVVTSAHAVPALAAVADKGGLPVLAVGEWTAAALRLAGFHDVRTGPGHAAGLAELVSDLYPSGARLLHVAGRHRKAEPEASLRARGHRVRVWETYEARAVERFDVGLVSRFRAGQFDVVLHFSRRSAGLFVELIDRAGLRPQLGLPIHLCLSPDVAIPLAGLAARIVVADAPREAAMLDAVDRLAREAP
jgi:uroporphyrinogen-III synthase